MTDLRAFFGDAEHAFRLTAEQIGELERVTGTGIGALSRRVFAGEFRHSDLIHTIRLGLIGAGTTPEEAAALVKAYAADRPINEAFPLAVAILESAWFGRPSENPVQLSAKAEAPE